MRTNLYTRWMAVREWASWRQYALAIAVVSVALAARWALDRVLDDRVPFITVFAVLLPMAQLVRPGPFLAGAALGFAGTFFLFIEPRYTFRVEGQAAAAQIAFYGVAMGAAVLGAWVLNGALRRERGASEMVRAFVDDSPALKCVLDADGRIVYANKALARALGRPVGEILGRAHTDVMPAGAAGTAREIEAVRASGAARVSIEEWPALEPGGEARSLEWRRFLLDMDTDGRALIAGMAHDVTEQARATRLMRDSERRLTRHLDGMKDLVEVGKLCARAGVGRDACLAAILNAAIRISEAQKGNIQLLDAPSATLVIAAQRGFDRRFIEYFARVGVDDASACGAALRLGHRVVVEDVERSDLFAGQPAGRELLEAGVRAVQSVPLISSDGLVLGIISTHFDRAHLPDERSLRLTDLLARQAADYLQRIRTDASMRSRGAELETVINRTPFMITRCGRDLRYRFVSAAYARMLRRDPNEITGRLIADIVGDEAFGIIRPHIERVLAGETVEYRARLPLPGAGERTLAVSYSPETDETGRVDGWIASILDVTGRDPPESRPVSEPHAVTVPEVRGTRPAPAAEV